MNILSLSQQRFGEHAQNYVTSTTHAKGADWDRLVEIAQPQPDWHVLNLAIGGSWGGQNGVDEKMFPTTYVIDYVRVFKLAE